MLFMNSWKIWESSAGEITDIIFTHLHWDHVHYLDRFVNVDLHVQRTEYQFAVNPIPLYYKSYEYPVLGLKPQFDGRSFKLYDGGGRGFFWRYQRIPHPRTFRWSSNRCG